MKKIIALFILLLMIEGCAAKPKHFYNLTIGSDLIIVGYDEPSILDGKDYINDYSTYLDKKEVERLESIEIYVDDLPTSIIGINETILTGSINDDCLSLKGELVNNNGVACVLKKSVKKKNNYIILTGDILDDDIDKLDRIQVFYK